MSLETLIGGLSRDEQIVAMELLWKRLTTEDPATAPPEWHRSVVAERVAGRVDALLVQHDQLLRDLTYGAAHTALRLREVGERHESIGAPRQRDGAVSVGRADKEPDVAHAELDAAFDRTLMVGGFGALLRLAGATGGVDHSGHQQEQVRAGPGRALAKAVRGIAADLPGGLAVTLVLGLLLGTVGIDVETGAYRMTFGIPGSPRIKRPSRSTVTSRSSRYTT